MLDFLQPPMNMFTALYYGSFSNIIFFSPYHPYPFFGFTTINSFYPVNALSFSVASMSPPWICHYFMVYSNLVFVVTFSPLSSLPRGLMPVLLSFSHDLQLLSLSSMDSVIISIYSLPILFPE